MAAYVIVDIEVHNPVAYREYLALITPTVAECGGRYLVRGAETEVVGGQWQPKRLVVMEFPSLRVARHWVYAERYQPIHALREANASVNMIIAEGSVDY